MRTPKKTIELEVLRMIYPRSAYKKVVEHERPDFIIRGLENFGVEVTEYYVDETSARLHRKPKYVGDVINANYIHKEDANKLEVVTVEYQDIVGRWRNIPGDSRAVRQENMQVTDRLALLIKAINKKSSLYNQYDNSLNAIDLIVYDARSSLLDGINDDYVRRTFHDIKTKGILSTRFRRVFVVIPVDNGKSNDVLTLKK